MNQELEAAIDIAVEAHGDQVGKDGQPYIHHPMYVMDRFHDDAHKVVAILHDVLEDTYVTAQDLIDSGISEDLVDAVLVVTKRRAETYFEYIRRVAESDSKIAKAVKIEDLKHNLSRSSKPGFEKLKRRYEKALDIMGM